MLLLILACPFIPACGISRPLESTGESIGYGFSRLGHDIFGPSGPTY